MAPSVRQPRPRRGIRRTAFRTSAGQDSDPAPEPRARTRRARVRLRSASSVECAGVRGHQLTPEAAVGFSRGQVYDPRSERTRLMTSMADDISIRRYDRLPMARSKAMSAKPTFFATPAAFRAWLEKHHASAPELLVGFYKTGQRQTQHHVAGVGGRGAVLWLDRRRPAQPRRRRRTRSASRHGSRRASGAGSTWTTSSG